MNIKEIVYTIKQRFERRIQKNMYRNLVFKGGGVRGIAYMGALKVLDELDVLIENGTLRATELVRHEIQRGDDDLVK